MIQPYSGLQVDKLYKCISLSLLEPEGVGGEYLAVQFDNRSYGESIGP